jgi:CheY-like chemotaxis protein
VDAVSDGAEAIALFTARPDHYDILITDHSMEDVSGPQLIDHFRAQGFAGKIIVMSGSLTDELMHDYLTKRVDKILQKPFTTEMLSSTFRDLLEQWKDEIDAE